MIHIQSIFEQQDSSLVNLNNVEITKIDELDWVASHLENNTQLKFINWKNNESFLNENKEIKSRIQNRLVSNILGDKSNELVIDLSEYDIDHDFLMRLAHSMSEKPGEVGQVILGERNQSLFRGSEYWSQIRSIVSKNNNNFRRYPSDAVHCMLASYCQNLSDSDIWSKLEQSGWKIENEIKTTDYHSILFRNDSTRHLVLAFRGPTLDFNECFTAINPQDKEFQTRMSQKLAIHCYYAYLHARASLELSEKLSFWLSFTGHGFGAWLAELAVLHCYRETGTTRVRAVTFESPGSGEMFYRLDDAQDFNEILDITSYLSCPNLVNTSSAEHKSIYDDEFSDFTLPPHHLGTVYFINDLYEERAAGSYKIGISQELKDFTNKLSEKTNDELLKSRLDELLSKDNRFYLEGLRCLFSENGDLKWMLEYIEKIKCKNGVNLQRVEFWPKIKSEIEKNEERKQQKIYPSLNYKELIENIPTGLVSTQIVNDSTSEKLYSDIVKIIEVKMSCITTTLSVLKNLRNKTPGSVPSLEFIRKDDLFLYKGEHFLFPESLVENGQHKIDFWQSYQVQKGDYKSDVLRNDELDSRLARFYFEQDLVDPKTELCDDYNHLKEMIEINIRWITLKYDRRIRSNQVEINWIRDRYTRLEDLREIHKFRLEKNCKNDENEDSEENWKSLETFIEPEDNIFEKIDKILVENKLVYIQGKSGCGKTTLAREYALHRKSAHKDLSIVFINSRNFEENVYELKERFLKSGNDHFKLEEILPLIKSNINRSKNEILFIFDDIKDLKEVNELISLIDPRHKIVITSKKSDILDISDDAVIELHTFNREKCKEYLRMNEIDLSNKVVDNFLETEKPVQLIELFAIQLKNNLIDFQGINFEKREKQMEYIMDQINRKDPLALEVLKHVSFLDRHNIGFELIEELFLNESEKILKKSLDCLVRIGYLKESGSKCYEIPELVQNDVSSNLRNEGYEIRLKLIQTLTRIIMIRRKLKLKIQLEKVKKIYKHIEKLTLDEESEFEINNYNTKLIKQLKDIIDENYYEMEKSIIMAEKVIKIIKKYCTLKIKTCRMRESKGRLKHQQGKFNEALECFEKNLKIQKDYYFDEKNEEIARTYNNIGSVYYSKGEYDKALEYYFKSLDIVIVVLSEKHHDIGILYGNIGSVLNSKGKYDKALEYLFKSLEILEKVLPEIHKNIASCYSRFGSVYISKGEYDKALEYTTKSLDIKKEVLPDNHPDIATSYGNIGLIYKLKGEYNQSLEYNFKSLDLEKEVLPENHPEIAISYGNIGSVYNTKGEYNKALEYYFKTLKIQKEVLAEKHPDIATSYGNIGSVYNAKGEFDKALEYHFKSLKIRKEVLPENHPGIAISYGNIGSVYISKGEYDKALEYTTKSLDIKKKVLPDNHPDIATSYGNIGLIFDSKGEYNQSLEYHFKSLKIRKEVLLENHPHIATSYNNIGSVLDSKGEYDKALEYYFKSLKIQKEVLPENHPDIATLYGNIGSVYNAKGEFDKALEYYLKTLKIRKDVLPENHPDIATSYGNIGSIFDSKGEYEKALEYYFKSLKIQKEVLPENHSDIAISYNNIGLVYCAKGEYNKSLEYYFKSLKIRKVLLENHPFIAISYGNIGSVFYKKGEFDKALGYYFKSLKKQKKVLPENHPHLAISYGNIGSVYNAKGEYDKALEYYFKTLNIQKEVLPENHPHLATTCKNIDFVNKSKGENDKCQKCYFISLKKIILFLLFIISFFYFWDLVVQFSE